MNLRWAHGLRNPGQSATLTVVWQERRDSNPRPLVLETSALPTELRSYKWRICAVILCYCKARVSSTNFVFLVQE